MNHRNIFCFALLIFVVSCSKENINQRFDIIAHQGYWKASAGASNSILGLTESVRLGIDGVEIDIRITADDSLVLCHDAKWGGNIVSNTSFSELRKTRLPDGSVIPTFREFVEIASRYDDIDLFIDVKASEAIPKICEILEEFCCSEQSSLLISPGLVEKTSKKYRKAKFLAMGATKDLKSIKENGAFGISVQIDELRNNPSIIKEAHNLGLRVNAWVIKSESEIIWCSQNGVDYVTTDSPKECKRFLLQ